MFRLIPLDEIPGRKDEMKEGSFHIAEYMIYSGSWVVEVDNNGYSIFDLTNRIALTHSFAEFLNRFLVGGVFDDAGLYDWANEIKWAVK